jgi:metal-responsive CopG/Arc/MetJ family transcriptional regulator
MKDVVVVNVRISREHARALDSLIKKRLYTSRSEAIREFCREYISDAREEK